MRTEMDVWNEMEALVKKGGTYRFESVDDEFEPFEGKPIKAGTEMSVEVTKGNGSLSVGNIVWIDASEFCFIEMHEVKP